MKVSNIRRTLDGPMVEISATVSGVPRLPVEGSSVWIRVPARFAGENSQPDGSPWLVALLPVAVSIGRPLEVEGVVGERLLAGCRKAMNIWRGWFRRLRPVEITVAAGAAADDDAGQLSSGVGCFFTGGVDSCYTVLKNQAGLGGPPITHLVFVHGLDIPLEDTELRSLVSGRLNELAGSLGFELIEAETNLRQLAERYVDWGTLQHGPALAAVGLAMSAGFGRLLIPASDAYDEIVPWASHPLVDPCWSTTATEFVHDGCEANRPEKISWQLAGSEPVLAHLRVCHDNPGGAYNCGECEKCIRTMVNLRVAGVLDRCSAFGRPLELGAVGLVPSSPASKTHARDNLKVLLRSGADPELQAALRRALRRRPGPRLVAYRLRRRLRISRYRLYARFS